MNYYLIGDDKSLAEFLSILNSQNGLRMVGDVANINFKPDDNTTMYSMIRYIKGDNDGHAISIGGGGIVVIGSGESARLLQPEAGSAGLEKTIVSSDNSIEFWVNCQNGLDAAKKVTLNTNGMLSGHQKAISSGTGNPSGGSNGDIYIQY